MTESMISPIGWTTILPASPEYKIFSHQSSEFKVKSQLSYYKLSLDGDVLIEIDVIGMVEIVGGVDLMAAHRAVLGL